MNNKLLFFKKKKPGYLDVLKISALPYLRIPPLETCKYKTHQVEMHAVR